jgi:hypothetical protein
MVLSTVKPNSGRSGAKSGREVRECLESLGDMLGGAICRHRLTLLRSGGEEGGPLLLDFGAIALGTLDLAFVVFGDGQDQ